MYYVKVHNESGKLDNIEILGLKNKMGTKGLPTAELLLDGVQARQLGETGRGIPNISTMLHLTRLHNAVAAIGACRYGVHMARSFAKERAAFGRTVDKFPLHVPVGFLNGRFGGKNPDLELRIEIVIFFRIQVIFEQFCSI